MPTCPHVSVYLSAWRGGVHDTAVRKCRRIRTGRNSFSFQAGTCLLALKANQARWTDASSSFGGGKTGRFAASKKPGVPFSFRVARCRTVRSLLFQVDGMSASAFCFPLFVSAFFCVCVCGCVRDQRGLVIKRKGKERAKTHLELNKTKQTKTYHTIPAPCQSQLRRSCDLHLPPQHESSTPHPLQRIPSPLPIPSSQPTTRNPPAPRPPAPAPPLFFAAATALSTVLTSAQIPHGIFGSFASRCKRTGAHARAGTSTALCRRAGRQIVALFAGGGVRV